MTTVFEIFIAGKTKTYAGQAARAAFDEIDRIESLFNRFDPSSEISRIGRLAAGERMMIGIETLECLGVAAQIQDETSGAFDINFRALRAGPGAESSPSITRGGRKSRAVRTVPSREAAGASHTSRLQVRRGIHRYEKDRKPAGRRHGISAGKNLHPRLLDLISLHRVPGGFEIVRTPPRAHRPLLPLDLDLGAIGKGYAVDSAMDVLEDWGITNTLVHAGTSTALAVGPGPDPRSRRPGWPVGISSPFLCPGAPRVVRLRDRALSGSGTEVKGAHIIDPRTGLPARRRPATFVSHPSAAVSDALSTAFFVMRPPKIAAYAASRPEAWALVILGPKTCKIVNPAAIR